MISYGIKSSQIKSSQMMELYDIVSIRFNRVRFNRVQFSSIPFRLVWSGSVQFSSVQGHSKQDSGQVRSLRSSQGTLGKRTQGDIDMVYVSQANRGERKWIWEKKFQVKSSQVIPYYTILYQVKSREFKSIKQNK